MQVLRSLFPAMNMGSIGSPLETTPVDCAHESTYGSAACVSSDLGAGKLGGRITAAPLSTAEQITRLHRPNRLSEKAVDALLGDLHTLPLAEVWEALTARGLIPSGWGESPETLFQSQQLFDPTDSLPAEGSGERYREVQALKKYTAVRIYGSHPIDLNLLKLVAADPHGIATACDRILQFHNGLQAILPEMAAQRPLILLTSFPTPHGDQRWAHFICPPDKKINNATSGTDYIFTELRFFLAFCRIPSDGTTTLFPTDSGAWRRSNEAVFQPAIPDPFPGVFQLYSDWEQAQRDYPEAVPSLILPNLKINRVALKTVPNPLATLCDLNGVYSQGYSLLKPEAVTIADEKRMVYTLYLPPFEMG